MARFPVELGDGKVIEVREFVDGEDRILVINDRHYRVYKGNEGHYFMLKISGMQRSVRGSLDDLRILVARVHSIYLQYDNRVRKSKEEAQRTRDRALNEIAESAK